MKVPSEIIEGFSTPEAVAQDLIDIGQRLTREREWYGKAPRFQNWPEILDAVGTGELVLFKSDENIQVIRRLRNPNLHAEYPPYLTPHAASVLHQLGKLWRQAADEGGVPKAARLAVTSLTRSQEYQDELVAAGKLAVPDSTHVTGNAFDIDLKGYYLALDNGKEATVSMREPAAQAGIAAAFELTLGVTTDPNKLVRLGPEYFNHEVSNTLQHVTTMLHSADALNVVVEMEATPNSVLHIAPNPGIDYLPQLG